MIRGLYTSGWSMMAINKQVDVISNNLANVNTNGFKRDIAVFQSFPDMLTSRIHDIKGTPGAGSEIGDMNISQDVTQVFTEYKQSKLIPTGNDLDISFQNSDSAFFGVSVPGQNGQATRQMYTRDGGFVVNANHQLVTKDGYPVLGERGPITLENGKFTVEKDGTITQNGQVVDRLLIRDFQDTTVLTKYGNNLVEAPADVAVRPFQGGVLQGYSEESNVNTIKEMVGMITAMRAYEANQKALRSQDDALEKTVNEVGSVG